MEMWGRIEITRVKKIGSSHSAGANIYDVFEVKAAAVIMRNTGMCMDMMDLNNLSYEVALRNGTYSQQPPYHV